MKTWRFRQATGLMILATYAACAAGDDRKAIPSCDQLEGQTVTLRGKVSEAWDNKSPNADFGEEFVLDPMETVLLVTLRRPICSAPENSNQNRPVVQAAVTIVEIVPGENAGV